MGGYNAKARVGVKEKLEAYVDDVTAVVTKDEEFLAVDNIFCMFKGLSGAILSRSDKSKVMGLGEY